MTGRQTKFRRGVRSNAFATWLRQTRKQLGMSQKNAVEAAGCAQQDWSRMERHGWVPSDDFLPKVCAAVGKPLAEAQELIAAGTSELFAVADQRYQAFKQGLIALERTGGEVGLFVIREDPQPVDRIEVSEFLEVLTATGQTTLSILFRYPSPKIWRSFHRLAHEVHAHATNVQTPSLDRLRAYHRHPEYAENADWSMPTAHPYLLACSGQGLSLSSGIFDEAVRQQELAAGFDEADARQRSLQIISHDAQAADEMGNWIGLQSQVEPLPNLWVHIGA